MTAVQAVQALICAVLLVFVALIAIQSHLDRIASALERENRTKEEQAQRPNPSNDY